MSRATMLLNAMRQLVEDRSEEIDTDYDLESLQVTVTLPRLGRPVRATLRRISKTDIDASALQAGALRD